MKSKIKPRTPLTLLGNSRAAYPSSPSRAKLETFANPSPESNYLITFDCPEFTSLCPVTGQPDFGRIEIAYVPDKLCIESKSLKFYLASFRNERSFNEAIVNRILRDLIAACRPRRLTVRGQFAQRGGISISVEAEYPDKGGSAAAAR